MCVCAHACGVCVCARMHVVCVCERMPARCGVCVCTQINIHIWRKVRLDRASVPAFFISYLTCHSVVGGNSHDPV